MHVAEALSQNAKFGNAEKWLGLSRVSDPDPDWISGSIYLDPKYGSGSRKAKRPTKIEKS
jgi:hypothetical protein